MWRSNWELFVADLKGIPSEVRTATVKPPATLQAVANFEKKINGRLPPMLRAFLLESSAGTNLDWRLVDRALVKLRSEREPIGCGEFAFGLDDLLEQNPQFRPGYDPRDYDESYRPAGLLAFACTPNGDQFAVVLDGPDRDAVKYLSHDLDDIHLYVVGKSFTSFMTEYARLGFAGPESWIWEQFTNGRTTPIDSTAAAAREFLTALSQGTRSAEAEALLQKAEIAIRRLRYQQFVLPEAERLRQEKDFAGFVRLLSDYTDLLSGSIKARYEYLLKQKRP